jgi:hypothetical protein
MIKLIPVCVVLLLVGCESAKAPFVTDLPGDVERLQTYLSEHRLQEAAWECIKLEQYDRADSILIVLHAILESDPVQIERWGGKGIMQNYVLTFSNGIQGFFKVAGSDTLGPIWTELATYEIDKLLRIHLTPITLIRRLDLPDGSTVKGVIKYFVQAAKTAEDLELKSEIKSDILLFFDTVVANADRHIGNWMIRDDTKELIAIDHNRTFQFQHNWTWYIRMKTIRDPRTLGQSYELYRSLPASRFRDVLKLHLTESEMVQFFESRSIIRYLDNIISGGAMQHRVDLPRVA